MKKKQKIEDAYDILDPTHYMENKLTKRKEKKKTKKFLFILLLIFFIAIFLFSVYMVVKWLIDNKKIEDQTEEIEVSTEIIETEGEIVNPPVSKEDPYWDYIKIPLISVNFDELMKTNNQTVGWIFVDGTNINYPVVQSKDNSYYLTHAFNKKWNDAGWIFMDYRNNSKAFDKNTIIYGHSRLDKTMFGSLRNITKNSWFKDTDNHIIKFSTPKENTMWQVFSVYTIKAESYYITTSFDDDSSYQTWLNTMLKRSVFNFKTSVDTDDKVITLSSCYTNNGVRVVLHAKLIKEEAR